MGGHIARCVANPRRRVGAADGRRVHWFSALAKRWSRWLAMISLAVVSQFGYRRSSRGALASPEAQIGGQLAGGVKKCYSLAPSQADWPPLSAKLLLM